MKYLTRLEEIYLLAIWRLKDNAYGMQIRKTIEEMTGRNIPYGAVYFTLEQLFKKNYVAKKKGESLPARGGCGKIFYGLTPSGRKALLAVFALQKNLWEDISLLSLKSSSEQ